MKENDKREPAGYAENKNVICGFETDGVIVNGAPNGIKTAFPTPVALAATFDTALIAQVARVTAGEILGFGGFGCYRTAGFLPGNEEMSFGSDGFLAYECCRAYAKGLEKCGVAAFPCVDINGENDAAIFTRWMKENASLGIAVSGEAESLPAVLARYRGLIYLKSVRALEVGANDNVSEMIKDRAVRYAEKGVAAGEAYIGGGVNAVSEDKARALADKIRNLRGRQNNAVPSRSSEANKRLALRAAKNSVVVVKNEGALPLPEYVKSVAVIGGAAVSATAACGYEGLSETPLAQLRTCFVKTDMKFCPYISNDKAG